MKRVVVFIFAGFIALGLLMHAFAQTTKDTGRIQFKGRVLTIVGWLNYKQSPTIPTGLDDWVNPAWSETENPKTDSRAIFRLVTNVDVLLTAPTQQILTHIATGETLATYYKITSDGNGTNATGFRSGESGEGVGSFFYVGGGSTVWETAKSLTPGTFLDEEKTITHKDRDGGVLLTVTVRGINGEELGADSDLTEAPDLGDYRADLVLRATYEP